MLGFAVFIILAVFGVIEGSPDVDPNIIAGVNATQGEFPFMVSLKHNNGTHHCGGSIIGPQWILTAGHCIEEDASKFQVYYGNVSVNNHVDNPNVNEHTVDIVDYIHHPNYTMISTVSTQLIRNDLCLLKLKYPLNYSEIAQPIKLPQSDEPVPIKQTATLIGWGTTDSDTYLQPDILQKVNLTIFDYPYCDSYNGKWNFSDAQNFCAGDNDNTRGQCIGDSGGPLFIDGIQWGIVSWSIKPCASAPGVFTKTSVFIDWIRNVTGIYTV